MLKLQYLIPEFHVLEFSTFEYQKACFKDDWMFFETGKRIDQEIDEFCLHSDSHYIGAFSIGESSFSDIYDFCKYLDSPCI